MGNKKNVVIFGCKNTTRYLINSLAEEIEISHIITISKEKNEKVNVPDYTDLTDLSIKYSIPIYYCNKYSLKNDNDLNYIKKLNIDISFVIGWQRLIPADLLNSVQIGYFGMHGSSSNLPKGRGRSPMNWSIIEGRKYFYTNLFKYNPGVDDGDIVDTVKFSITSKDNAETMHYKNMISMKFLILKNLSDFFNNTLNYIPQKNLKPTYYPKRNPEDSLIDWNLEINILDQFIRAVSKPFNGAFTFIKNEKLTIYSAQIFDIFEFDYSKFKNGSILDVFESNKFIIKCNGGIFLVNDYICGKKITKGDICGNSKYKIKKFKTNNEGFYDI